MKPVKETSLPNNGNVELITSRDTWINRQLELTQKYCQQTTYKLSQEQNSWSQETIKTTCNPSRSNEDKPKNLREQAHATTAGVEESEGVCRSLERLPYQITLRSATYSYARTGTNS